MTVQFLSQCGITYCCQSTSVPEVYFAICVDVKQPRNSNILYFIQVEVQLVFLFLRCAFLGFLLLLISIFCKIILIFTSSWFSRMQNAVSLITDILVSFFFCTFPVCVKGNDVDLYTCWGFSSSYRLTCSISNNNNHIQRCNSRFFTISPLCRELSPTRTLMWPGRIRVQIMCNTSSAYLVQHVMLNATWYEGTAQLLNLTELEIVFILALFYWLDHWSDEGGEETGVPGENPWRWASDNVTCWSVKIQAPNKTQTCTIASVAG